MFNRYWPSGGGPFQNARAPRTTSQGDDLNRHLARRSLLLAAAAAAAFAAAPAARAQAAAWPNKPIRLVVPFPAGTSPDVIARHWSDRLAKAVGQPVVVDNKPGAATIIGAQLAATAPADGYTVLYTAQNTMSINPHVYKSLPYKPSDFVPVSHVASVPLVLIVPANSPYRTMKDLLDAARAAPGKLNYASYGIGQGTHVVMARLLHGAGVQMTHVPYKDGGILDVMGGAVNVSFEASTSALPQIAGGKLRALAVTSTQRLEALPNVPTVAESVPGFIGDSWHGVFVPKGTPADVIARISAESQKIVASDDFRARLREAGLTPKGGTPADFAAYLADESRVWAQVVKENDIRVD
jgi:tripartite-type tricarboxylate transporter receptor subunit TctC